MTLEAEKIDLRTAKLQAEHEVKTIKSQLERERIEVARQRDVREKGTVCVSAVCACVCLSPRVRACAHACLCWLCVCVCVCVCVTE